MKLKHIIPFILAASLMAVSCGKEYDDSALHAKIDALASQVTKLAQQVNELNTQVSGFNTILENWKAGGYIQDIQSVNGAHTITFLGGKTVTIYDGKDGTNGQNGTNGTNGQDGATPVISVKADTDGVLYWAVNGEFLKDGNGKNVPVTAVPNFSVNDQGELIVTVAGVQTNLGKIQATGSDIFTSVSVEDGVVHFVLAGGQSFDIPLVEAFKLVIGQMEYGEVTAGSVVEVPYTVQNGENATVMAFANGFYKAEVNAAEQKVLVTVPSPASDGQVMVWAQNEKVVSPIVILSFTAKAGEGGGETPSVVVVSDPAVYTAIPVAGGEVNVSITSNVDIVVEQPSVSWVTVSLTKADYTLTLTLQENTGSQPRETTLKINRADNGATVQTIKIAQLGTGEPAEPSDNPYGQASLPVIAAATTWAGSFFDNLINENAGSTATEWISGDGVNFISEGLGFLAGYTEGVDSSTGAPKTTYGKFKFKKSETAYTSGTKMSRVQVGGAGEVGKRNLIQIKVAGSGTLTVIGRSSGDAARKFNIAVNDVPMDDAGFELPGKAADSQTLAKEVTATEGDVLSLYSMEGGINFYSIKWTPAGDNPGGDEPGGDEPGGGDDPTPGENADLSCPNPPTVGDVSPTGLVGYAAAVTGGAGTGSKTLHFNNGKALQTWLLQRTKDEKKGDHTPTVIWLSGTFTDTDGRDFSSAHPWFDVKDVSNLSFIGTDSFVMDRIGIFCVRANNIIIRNIYFKQPKANNGADAVSMQECNGVWVDHCTFESLNQTKDYEDGSTDVTHASKNVTVSWNHYIKTQKSCLVGHSNSASADKDITATFHHNWFDQSSSRHPRVRFGTVHVYNNLFDGNTTYGVGSAYGAKVLVEYNYFDGVQLPTDICTYPAKDGNVSNLQGSVAGYLYPTQNIYVNRPAKAKDPYPLSNVQYTAYNGSTITPLTYADFKPAYSYTVTAAGDVPALVKANAGAGQMEGYASAPVEVDNGGITDFNGTDEDPVNPDEGDSDEPGDTPAAGLADGWNWVINNGATASYSLSEGALTVSSTGKWESKAQSFGAIYREVAGDFTATVELVSYTPQKTGSNQACAGLILLAGNADATATDLLFALGGDTYGNFRVESGKDKSGSTLGQPEATGGKTVLKMVREGSKVKVSVSKDGGASFGNVSSKEFTVALPETVLLGVACNSGDNSKASTAVFKDFTVNDSVINF